MESFSNYTFFLVRTNLAVPHAAGHTSKRKILVLLELSALYVGGI